ncbi:hypothetical protein CSUI_000680 [Cystoisospora suis]|uniref:Protein kinase domain-containing protein n=1 Tax=Cystoisospora suis TaxID=483139 RepID=A0A2C6LFQ5_9APIC|nr:hypothetical protein CSUI_000680 [Cystoisospora suis]
MMPTSSRDLDHANGAARGKQVDHRYLPEFAYGDLYEEKTGPLVHERDSGRFCLQFQQPGMGQCRLQGSGSSFAALLPSRGDGARQVSRVPSVNSPFFTDTRKLRWTGAVRASPHAAVPVADQKNVGTQVAFPAEAPSPGWVPDRADCSARTPILWEFGSVETAATPSPADPAEYSVSDFSPPGRESLRFPNQQCSPTLRCLRINSPASASHPIKPCDDTRANLGSSFELSGARFPLNGRQYTVAPNTPDLGSAGTNRPQPVPPHQVTGNFHVAPFASGVSQRRETAVVGTQEVSPAPPIDPRSGPHIRVRSFVVFQPPRSPGPDGETSEFTDLETWAGARVLPLKSLVGSGAMGHVYLVELKGQQYALKLAVQSDSAACTYLRHGWRSLVRLENMHLAEMHQNPSAKRNSKKDGAKSKAHAVYESMNSSGIRTGTSWRYYCKPVAFLEGDWIRREPPEADGATSPDGSPAGQLQVSPICGYVMEYIPNACQLTALIWSFHRTSNLSKLLRADKWHGVVAKRLVEICLHVAAAHKLIACKAGMFSFDFNPKNILVSVTQGAHNSGQKQLSATDITRMVLCDPSVQFRVVAIDLDCSLRVPFSASSHDGLLLDWTCGRRVVYSCPHVSSITAAYILAVLAKNKGEGQFSRSGLKEQDAHAALCQRVQDTTNFLHFCWCDQYDTVPEVESHPFTSGLPPGEESGGNGSSPDASVGPDPGDVKQPYLPCFVYPLTRLPRTIPQKEYRKFGVRLVGQHVNLQLLAFILCELLDFRSLHVVVLQRFSRELRMLQLPTDICKMFVEQDQIISCLCFSALTKMKSSVVPTHKEIFGQAQKKDSKGHSRVPKCLLATFSPRTRLGIADGTDCHRPQNEQSHGRAGDQKVVSRDSERSKACLLPGIAQDVPFPAAYRIDTPSPGERQRSPIRHSAGPQRIRAAPVVPENDTLLYKQTATQPRNLDVNDHAPAPETRRLLPDEVARMSVWEKVEKLPPLCPQDFLPSADLLGRRCEKEMSSLNRVLLQFLDPHPFFALRYKSPEAAFDAIIHALDQLRQRLEV